MQFEFIKVFVFSLISGPLDVECGEVGIIEEGVIEGRKDALVLTFVLLSIHKIILIETIY